MKSYTDETARAFEQQMQFGTQRLKIEARKAVTLRGLHMNPEYREAVTNDIQALATNAALNRGYADLHDLTGQGYSEDIALHFAEHIAQAARNPAATRRYDKGAAA